MELLAKLSFQERACQGNTGCGNQRIPGCSGKDMVPIGAKLWFKAQCEREPKPSRIRLRDALKIERER